MAVALGGTITSSLGKGFCYNFVIDYGINTQHRIRREAVHSPTSYCQATVHMQFAFYATGILSSIKA